MNLKERINKANKWIAENKPIQENWFGEFIFDFPIDIFPEDMVIKQVWESRVDKHRWYGLQDMVFEFTTVDKEVEYVKTTLVTQSYSEMQCLGDIFHSYPQFKFVRPVEVMTIEYQEVE